MEIPQNIIVLYDDFQAKADLVKDEARGEYMNEKRSATWAWKRFDRACRAAGLNSGTVSVRIQQSRVRVIKVGGGFGGAE